MNILSGVSDFFGLDIGTTAIRAVQLKGAGEIRALDTYGQIETEGTITVSDAPSDRAKVAQAVRQLVHESNVTSKNVAVNLPSHRVFTTVIDMDRLAPAELAKTIRYQADSFIPTPLAESKIDWAIIGDSPKDAKKIEVLLSSTPNEFVEARMDMLESIGLNVIAIEPDNMALARALIAADAASPQMALDVGSNTTDLVIVMGGVPRLTRSIPTGSHTLIRAAAQNLNVDAKQAEQFVFKFGLGKDKLEGRVFTALSNTIDNLMAEIDKSIKFFQGRYANAKIEQILVTGGASAIPEFPLYIANKFGINVGIGNAWRNVNVPASQQNELMAVSNHFAVAVGLAERSL